MGDVYEVTHLETEMRCALKIMQAHVLRDDRMRQRFRQEARITSKIQSEFIVTVFDAGIDDATGLPFIVMELLHGEELKQRVRRLGCLSPAEVTTYIHQTALALDKTHKAFIVHRDLKPDNLFLTQREDGSPRIKVLDFGIAKILAGDGAGPNITIEMMGTPFYMAPEQYRSDLRISPAADIYSLGMIAYTLLVGIPYWKEDLDNCGNVLLFATIAVHGPVEPACARARRRGVPLPSAFDPWFARATAVSAGDRFPSALVAASSLADVLGVARPGQVPFPMHADAAVAMRRPQTIPMVRASQPSAAPPAALPAFIQRSPRSMPAQDQRSRPDARERIQRSPAAPQSPALRSPLPAQPPAYAPGAAPPAPDYVAPDHGVNTFSAATTIPVRAVARKRIVELAGLTGIAMIIGLMAFLVIARDWIRPRAASADPLDATTKVHRSAPEQSSRAALPSLDNAEQENGGGASAIQTPDYTPPAPAPQGTSKSTPNSTDPKKTGPGKRSQVGTGNVGGASSPPPRAPQSKRHLYDPQ
jgi:serine/threonine-protein kinase